MAEHIETYNAPFEKVLSSSWGRANSNAEITNISVEYSSVTNVTVTRYLHSKITIPYLLKWLFSTPIRVTLKEKTEVDFAKKSSISTISLHHSNVEVSKYIEVEQLTIIREDEGKTRYITALKLRRSSLPSIATSFFLKQWLMYMTRFDLLDGLPNLPTPSISQGIEVTL